MFNFLLNLQTLQVEGRHGQGMVKKGDELALSDPPNHPNHPNLQNQPSALWGSHFGLPLQTRFKTSSIPVQTSSELV